MNNKWNNSKHMKDKIYIIEYIKLINYMKCAQSDFCWVASRVLQGRASKISRMRYPGSSSSWYSSPTSHTLLEGCEWGKCHHQMSWVPYRFSMFWIWIMGYRFWGVPYQLWFCRLLISGADKLMYGTCGRCQTEQVQVFKTELIKFVFLQKRCEVS